jgi:hypothetical protein
MGTVMQKPQLLNPDEIQGIFDNLDEDLFIRYRVECQFTDKLMGGTPQKGDLIAGWIRARAGVDEDVELAAMVRRTLGEIGVETPEEATLDEIIAVSEKVGAERHGNTFKRDAAGLYIETRQVKSGLKESCSVLFAGERWGRTKKGPKNALSEWIFVEGQRVHLGRMEPDGTWTQHGVVSGPSGSRSTLTQYDYVEQPRITFVLKSLMDPQTGKERIEQEQWKLLLTYLQYSGLGALRSQSHGQFKVMAFKKI